MPRPTTLLALVLTLVAFCGVATAADQPVRVLLGDQADGLTVTMTGAHRGRVDDLQRFDTPFALDWPLRVDGDRLLVDDTVLGRSLTLEPVDGLIEWEGQRYRGALRLLARDGRVRVINVIDLEDYLRGVVPAEMQASWPLEALKAQAVAARTYTLASLRSRGDFDLCATKECQVYRGVRVEHPRSDLAVEETAGVVLTFGGDYARTYYHADSGGVVASSAEVWGMSLPYLVARADVSVDSPHRAWQLRLDGGAVAASISQRGVDLGEVRALRVLAYSESGRVTQLEVQGSVGTTVLAGARLRALLRSWGLKSTRFQMVGALVAQGDGWGHGVGMSQYGARDLALANYTYGQILAFYYPSTQLQRLEYASGH